jgi:hypothetical protein
MASSTYLGVASWFCCMFFIKKWAFGFHFDVWTWGCDIMLGLGLVSPRYINVGGKGLFQWNGNC